MVGEYVVHKEITEQELAVFHCALKGLLGVSYTPRIVASQIVRGINYLFVCTGEAAVPNAPTKIYLIKIYMDTVSSTRPTVELQQIAECPVTSLLDIMKQN